MVVSPKYKHFDGISYVGETRVRVNDTEERLHGSWKRMFELAFAHFCKQDLGSLRPFIVPFLGPDGHQVLRTSMGCSEQAKSMAHEGNYRCGQAESSCYCLCDVIRQVLCRESLRYSRSWDRSCSSKALSSDGALSSLQASTTEGRTDPTTHALRCPSLLLAYIAVGLLSLLSSSPTI